MEPWVGSPRFEGRFLQWICFFIFNTVSSFCREKGTYPLIFPYKFGNNSAISLNLWWTQHNSSLTHVHFLPSVRPEFGSANFHGRSDSSATSFRFLQLRMAVHLWAVCSFWMHKFIRRNDRALFTASPPRGSETKEKQGPPPRRVALEISGQLQPASSSSLRKVSLYHWSCLAGRTTSVTSRQPWI